MSNYDAIQKHFQWGVNNEIDKVHESLSVLHWYADLTERNLALDEARLRLAHRRGADRSRST
jgi:hypothetical protein